MAQATPTERSAVLSVCLTPKPSMSSPLGLLLTLRSLRTCQGSGVGSIPIGRSIFPSCFFPQPPASFPSHRSFLHLIDNFHRDSYPPLQPLSHGSSGSQFWT